MNDNNNQAELYNDDKNRSCTIDYHDYDESEGQNLRKMKGKAPLTENGSKSTQKKSTTFTETKKNEDDIKDIKEVTKTEVRQEPKKKLFEANEEQKAYKTELNKESVQNFVKNIHSSECSSIKKVNDINLIPQNSSNPINTQSNENIINKVSLEKTNENKIENELPEGNRNEINYPAPGENEKEKTIKNENENGNSNNNERPMSIDGKSEGEGKAMSVSEENENAYIINNNQNTELNNNTQNNNTTAVNNDSTSNRTHNFNNNNDGMENNLQLENYDIEILKNESSNEDNDDRLNEEFHPPNTNYDNRNQ
jgi:hypothetical protein